MRLLIVDDEIQIRTGLREGIPWEEIGFGEVYIAQNGIEALDICSKYRPEIVITDIRIPGMSGLELGKAIKSLYEPVEIIVLSGYSEFEYAREAISIRVFQYLLKPIRINELIECVKGAKNKIEEFWTDHQSKNEYHMLNRTRTLQQLMRSNMLLSTEDEKSFQELMGPCSLKDIFVGVFSADTLLEKELDQSGLSLKNYLHDILEKYKAQELFWERGNLFFIMGVFSEHDRKRKTDSLKKDMESLNVLLEKELCNSFSLAVSSIGAIKEVALLFGEAENILKKRMYLGKSSFLEKQDCDENQKLTLSPINVTEVQQRIDSLDYEHIHLYLQKIFKELEEN